MVRIWPLTVQKQIERIIALFGKCAFWSIIEIVSIIIHSFSPQNLFNKLDLRGFFWKTVVAMTSCRTSMWKSQRASAAAAAVTLLGASDCRRHGGLHSVWAKCRQRRGAAVHSIECSAQPSLLVRSTSSQGMGLTRREPSLRWTHTGATSRTKGKL